MYMYINIYSIYIYILNRITRYITDTFTHWHVVQRIYINKLNLNSIYTHMLLSLTSKPNFKSSISRYPVGVERQSKIIVSNFVYPSFLIELGATVAVDIHAQIIITRRIVLNRKIHKIKCYGCVSVLWKVDKSCYSIISVRVIFPIVEFSMTDDRSHVFSDIFYLIIDHDILWCI